MEVADFLTDGWSVFRHPRTAPINNVKELRQAAGAWTFAHFTKGQPKLGRIFLDFLRCPR